MLYRIRLLSTEILFTAPPPFVSKTAELSWARKVKPWMVIYVLFVIQKPTPLLSKNTRGLGLLAAFGAFVPVPQRTRSGPPVLLLYESISDEDPVHVSPGLQSVATEQARHPSPLQRFAL